MEKCIEPFSHVSVSCHRGFGQVYRRNALNAVNVDYDALEETLATLGEPEISGNKLNILIDYMPIGNPIEYYGLSTEDFRSGYDDRQGPMLGGARPDKGEGRFISAAAFWIDIDPDTQKHRSIHWVGETRVNSILVEEIFHAVDFLDKELVELNRNELDAGVPYSERTLEKRAKEKVYKLETEGRVPKIVSFDLNFNLDVIAEG